MQTYKRRNYFIDKGSQSRFIVGFAVSSMLGGIAGIASFVYFAHRKIDATLYSMRLPEIAVADLLMNEMLLALVITILFVLVLFVLTAGKVFKRLNGPLKKMVGVVHRIGNGDLRDGVSLRKNDEFKILADELDGLVENLRQRFSTMRSHGEKLTELRHTDLEAGDRKEQVRLHLQALKKELDSFKI
jgi:methyl-accepting chemotaxis protein